MMLASEGITPRVELTTAAPVVDTQKSSETVSGNLRDAIQTVRRNAVLIFSMKKADLERLLALVRQAEEAKADPDAFAFADLFRMLGIKAPRGERDVSWRTIRERLEGFMAQHDGSFQDQQPKREVFFEGAD
jgi:hypothetical protein